MSRALMGLGLLLLAPIVTGALGTPVPTWVAWTGALVTVLCVGTVISVLPLLLRRRREERAAIAARAAAKREGDR